MSTNAYTGAYGDGIVVDYTSTLGRISVGPSDSLKFYNGGPASTETLVIDSTGNIVTSRLIDSGVVAGTYGNAK